MSIRNYDISHKGRKKVVKFFLKNNCIELTRDNIIKSSSDRISKCGVHQTLETIHKLIRNSN